jgi:hypothetical protein
MIKYKILIIDDDWESRRTGFESVLGGEYFDFDYIENASPTELERIKFSKAHAIILDVNLDNWAGNAKSDLFQEIVKLILMRAPVFLISNNWNQENIKWVNNSKDLINIRYYLSWDNDIQAILNTQTDYSYSSIRENIKRELDEFHAKESMMIGEDETLKILQISDLQFGDNGFDEDSSLLEHLIPVYLHSKGISNINLIIVAGDVVYAGLPSEYETAKIWFDKFCPQLLGTNYKSRLLLIPGNHDVNLRLNAADIYKFDFKTKKLIDLPDNITNEHHAYGLTPYKEFAFEMTGNQNYINNKNRLCFVNDRFVNWGLRFYHLNSVAEQNYINPDKAGIPEIYLSNLLHVPEVPKSTYNVILSHHDPQSYGYDPMGVWRAEWNTLSKFIQAANINMYLHGHRHQFKTYAFQDEGKGLDDIRLHMTGTMSLRASHRIADSKRGFSIIELPRKKGVVQVNEVRITDYGIDRGFINVLACYDLFQVKRIDLTDK